MSKQKYSILTIVAVSFVLVLGAGVFNVSKADPGTSGERSTLTTSNANQFGNDQAVHSPRLLVRDLEADAPHFSQDRDDFDRDVTYPSGFGYGNLGGGS